RDFEAQQRFLPREAAVFLAPSMYFYPPLRPGGDLLHRQVLAKACKPSLTKRWSRFAKFVCEAYSRSGNIDWRIPLAHPRAFVNQSFTRHLMFSSWFTDSAAKQRYRHVDNIKDLKVTTPGDFLNLLNNRVMSSFEYEKKVLSLEKCKSS
ncbi:MAG: hypothetical protein AAGK05_16040, partial [Pseudomonadota bacterium]